MNVKPNSKSDEPNINYQIKADPVRLVGPDGEMLGVVPLRAAQAKASEAGLDLVEVSPNAAPPVCKILDYGKFRFEAQKKLKEAKKKQKVIHIKEIKIRIGIGEHDYQVKLRAARGFLEEKDKVKVTLRFRGREIAHNDLAYDLFKRFATDLAEQGKIEQDARMEGRQMAMVLTPQ